MLLDSISKIQINLHAEALNTGFYSQSEQALEEHANAFIDNFCLKNNLTWHTISPLRWSFESAQYGIYDHGVIELNNIDNDKTAFECITVDEAKITDPE